MEIEHIIFNGPVEFKDVRGHVLPGDKVKKRLREKKVVLPTMVKGIKAQVCRGKGYAYVTIKRRSVILTVNILAFYPTHQVQPLELVKLMAERKQCDAYRLPTTERWVYTAIQNKDGLCPDDMWLLHDEVLVIYYALFLSRVPQRQLRVMGRLRIAAFKWFKLLRESQKTWHSRVIKRKNELHEN